MNVKFGPAIIVTFRTLAIDVQMQYNVEAYIHKGYSVHTLALAYILKIPFLLLILNKTQSLARH